MEKLSKEEQRKNLQHEADELERVGKHVFGGEKMPPVEIDTSVLKDTPKKEQIKCCMCKIADDKVATLKCGTHVHPQCMENACLQDVVKVIGWKEDEYTMQMRVLGTIPPMRTLYLTGSKCKVVTRNKEYEKDN